MNSFLVETNKISIFAETFGDRANPCILLIMGATAQGIMWDEDFCYNLASAGYFVIRYDHRDTGKSTRVNYVEQPYELSDLAFDALGILDYLKIDSAHFMAASMGSFISQWIAINHPNRVKSLCLIMSSPDHHAFIDGFEGRDMSHHSLPPSNPNILKFYQKIVGISASSSDEVNKVYRDIWKGIENHEDEEIISLRINEGKILRRLKNEKYVHNHSLALAKTPSLASQLSLIQAPTLLIHGELDYILPVEHALRLSKSIKGSLLKIYKRMGHGFDPDVFKQITSDFVEFNKIKLT